MADLKVDWKESKMVGYWVASKVVIKVWKKVGWLVAYLAETLAAS